MDFRSLLSQEQQRRIDRHIEEVTRIYGLQDRWLAEELLRLARRARAEACGALDDPMHFASPDALLVWHVIPELARRLGSGDVRPNEAFYSLVRSKSDQELRSFASWCLSDSTLERISMTRLQDEKASAAHLLGNEPINGNAMVIGLDRLVQPLKPGNPNEDRISRGIRSAARLRGHRETQIWTPALLKAAHNLRLVENDPAPGMGM